MRKSGKRKEKERKARKAHLNRGRQRSFTYIKEKQQQKKNKKSKQKNICGKIVIIYFLKALKIKEENNPQKHKRPMQRQKYLKEIKCVVKKISQKCKQI